MRQCGITRRLHSNLGRSTSSDSREVAWDCAGEDLLPAIHSRLMLLHAHTQVCVISLCFPRGGGSRLKPCQTLVLRAAIFRNSDFPRSSSALLGKSKGRT